MKVLIATGLYPPDIGGPATYTKFLERHFPRHGIAFAVAAFSAVRKYPRLIRHLIYIVVLMKKARSMDVIYALDTVSVGVPALLVSRLMRKKLYLRVPGDYAWEQGQQRFGITRTLDEYLKDPVRPVGVRVLAWLQTRVARSATRVIVPSDYMKGVVEAWGVIPQNITRIYSALNPISVPATKETLRTQFAYTGFVVTTAARLTPWKGIDALIEAVCTLHTEGVDISLDVIGDGTERAHLSTLIQEKNADSYIHLRGMLGKQELAERIKASDVFVLNTSYEGLSHQLIEVMDIGTPIITTSVGGNGELITHEEEGILIAYNDTRALVEELNTIRTNASLGARLVHTAQKKVSRFREDTIIPEIISLFT